MSFPDAWRGVAAAGLTLLAVLVTAGCERGPVYVPVKGTVTLDGTPLTSGVVQFRPVVGQVATGEIGPGGEFELTTHPGADGVLAGSYRVTVLAYDPTATEQAPEHLIVPLRYTRFGTSGLEVTIFQGSTAPVELSLVSDPPSDDEARPSSITAEDNPPHDHHSTEQTPGGADGDTLTFPPAAG